jgi:hypothetical protein
MAEHPIKFRPLRMLEDFPKDKIENIHSRVLKFAMLVICILLVVGGWSHAVAGVAVQTQVLAPSAASIIPGLPAPTTPPAVFGRQITNTSSVCAVADGMLAQIHWRLDVAWREA